VTEGQVSQDNVIARWLDRRTELRPILLELIERLAALIALPRLHRHRYNGCWRHLSADSAVMPSTNQKPF
jgi:hypothetical protein